jgi:hypothetical protein
MPPSTRPTNAERRFTEFDQDDDNFPSAQQVEIRDSAITLGYHLDHITQANQAAQDVRQQYALDPTLSPADYTLDPSLDEADLSFASTSQQHPPDSAYGGSPYPNPVQPHTYGTSRGGKNKGPKNFLCTFGRCRKAFARKSDLVRHQRIHTNER